MRAAIGITLGLVLLGCAPRLELGAPCAGASDCTAPLVCQLGRCRTECLADRDCPLGVTCVFVAPGLGACTLESENRCSETVCPSPLVCEANVCSARCATDANCLSSQRCAGEVCVARSGTDAGTPTDAPVALCSSVASCGAGEICASDYPPSVCRTECTAHADCQAIEPDSVCDWYDADVDGGRVLGCSTVCRPGTAEGCPAGLSCRMGFRSGAVIPTGPSALTICSPARPSGTEGCECMDLDSSGECAAGLSCEIPSEGRMCLRICALGTDCAPMVPCERTPRSVVIRGVEYGVCPSPVPRPIVCP